ncbi:hypothetical protein RSOLAG22IIIB_01419 [Rhizoctonia solani]|uniref:Uncharacterized protein n=1 Tax=Rhizoctonia solani TaxID=456999 RepID=A0A0K6G5L0_9AGAM|nr:hypothetical protein RSOLAG22IIIB_01419 [Rhizoctonia solani]
MRPHTGLHSGPYSTTTVRATSLSVAQARSHRLTRQDQHWTTPQPQGVANTFPDSSATSNSAYGSPLDNSWNGDGSLAVPNYDDNITSTYAPYDPTPATTTTTTGLDQSYGATFASSLTPRDYPSPRSPLENLSKSSGSYTSAEGYHSPSYSTSVADNTTLLNPFSSLPSQVSPFTHGAEIPSIEPNYVSNPSTPAQYQQFSSTTQHQSGFDTSYPTSFGGAYRPIEGAASTDSTPVETFQAPPMYDDQHSYYSTYDERRGSITSSLPEYRRNYHTNNSQNNSPYAQPIEQNSAGASPHYNASPAAMHTPSPRQVPSQGPIGSDVHGVGSTESVSRRLGLMLRNQKYQQDEQTERAPIKHPSSRGRRDKRSPTSDIIDDEGMNSLAKYKAAYERVRLQRNFYERATSSLVHQVNMLGGDPMQASKRASKGEDLDPKGARILVASLQHELEILRNKLIQTQKELHSIRQSCDDSSRSLRRRVNSGNFSRDEDDKAPLSAAPVTVYTHSRRR